MKKLRKLMQDPRGYAWILIQNISTRSVRTLSSIGVYILFRMKGVLLGRNCVFYGIPKVVRHPFSEIRIGHSSSFRSRETSNLVGLNHRCIMSTFGEGSEINIGDNVGLSGVTIGSASSVSVGDGTLCGANVFITDFDWHNTEINNRRSADKKAKPVVIGKNVWIGANSVILKGVEIGENSVIGANSVVTKSIPANVVAAGNPCVVIKELN